MMRAGAAFAALAALLHPYFFVLYRLGSFHTVPRDDYAPYLLWIVGKGGFVPDSPYCYRVVSMLAAIPFYWVLPAIPLTNIPGDAEPEMLRATVALAVVAYLAWVATGMLSYAGALRAGLGQQDAVLAGALSFALMGYVQLTAIDPLALALIAAAVWLLPNRRAFAAVLAVSVPCNEKVALVLAIWLVIRCVLSRADRARFGWQAAAAVLAVAAYLVMVRLVHLPGNSYQIDPGHYPATLRDNLLAYASPRGLMLNVAPIVVLAALSLLGRHIDPFRRADMLLIPALACVALVLTQFYQAGRIVMHAAPIFVIPAAGAVTGWLAARSSPVPERT